MHDKNKKVSYRTPGRECPHADSGCCPQCLRPCERNIRFTSRQPLSTYRTRK